MPRGINTPVAGKSGHGATDRGTAMAIVKLPDGTEGYVYPTGRGRDYPNRSPRVGQTIMATPYTGATSKEPIVILRLTGRESKYFGVGAWVAPVRPDGSLGRMTIRHLYAYDLDLADAATAKG